MIKASRMYRMPENNQEVKRFWAALEVFFFSVCKSPTQSLNFHRTEISWLFLPLFDLFRFILYYFVQAEFFHANLRFQKEKKKLRGNVVFTTMAIRVYFASLTLICKLLFIRRISLGTKMAILNSQMIAFLGTLFILAITIL